MRTTEKDKASSTRIERVALREMSLEQDGIIEAERRVRFTFMTEAPCDNWYVPESVLCGEENADLTRFKNKVMPCLFNHDRDTVLGRVDRIYFEEQRAKAEVVFDTDKDAEEIFQKVLSGSLRGVSVGYQRITTTRVKAGQEFLGRTYAVDTDVTSKWMPFEVSIVSVPADADAGVGRDMQVKSLEEEKETEKMTKEEGKKDLPTPEVPINVAEEVERAVEAERNRVKSVNCICRQFNVPQEKVDSYLDNKEMTVAKVNEEILKDLAEKQEKTKVVVTRDAGDTFVRQATQGMMMRFNVPIEDKIDGAEKYSQLSLRDLGSLCLEAGGAKNTRFMSSPEIFDKLTAYRAMGSEQFSAIIDEYSHKSMLAAYKAHPAIFTNFVSKGSNSDFKKAYRYQLGLDGVPVLMPQESGEFKYQSVTDQKVSTQISTYGKGIALTREIFVNDDMGVVQRAISMQGNGFRRLQEKMFFETLTSKVTFSAAKKNLVQTNKTISALGYGEMIELMTYQKDFDNEDFIGVPPAFILAPANQVQTHKVLLESGSNPAQNNAGVKNPVQGAMTLFTSPYLSGTAYYAIARPIDMEGIEYTTLNNVDAPQSRIVTPSEFLGMKIQLWMDFGFNVISEKAFVKNPNA